MVNLWMKVKDDTGPHQNNFILYSSTVHSLQPIKRITSLINAVFDQKAQGLILRGEI